MPYPTPSATDTIVRFLGVMGPFMISWIPLTTIEENIITAAPPNRDLHKTALGAEQSVAWTHHASTAACIDELHAAGYRVLAVEQVEGAAMLDALTVDPGARYALVFGNEVEGVSQEAVDRCDGAVEIPQLGTKHSLNVAVSGGVVLWEFFCLFHSKA